MPRVLSASMLTEDQAKSGRNNSLVKHCEGLSNSCHAASTNVEYALPSSRPAAIISQDQRGGTIHYGCGNSSPAIRPQASIEHVPNTGTPASTCMSIGRSSGWPDQVAWGSMPSTTALDLRRALPSIDWVLDWSQGEYLTQSDAGEFLHPPCPVQGPGVLSFQSEPGRPQNPRNSVDMDFCDEWPQRASCVSATGGGFGPEEQGPPRFPPFLTGLHNILEPESQDSAFERPLEGPVSPPPTELCPMPNRIELDMMTTPHEHFPLFDTGADNVEYEQFSQWLQRSVEYRNNTQALN
ncbi:hypothetical protein Asppvi_002000 [Aspergillus pseudoviridinutans]|uniref:Uncharacterized protein n=1 Tax=Aspergillus pseudoviridinutans TaxID=1517512 RepID=A0A9P3F0P6_9EURO|nr:uncharacterized protein Asppvi_002000 [Aspergillus pseudoviridinutans]GIJ92722.1 hypothetical protein Asppvi_002000 [Aspergillus pseudoviridinutans]